MIIIGLCGGSGAGKGTVANLFCEHGIPSIDADAVYRDLTFSGSPLILKLAEAFGKNILTSSGTLNRKALSSIVFSNKEKLKLLNSVTHGAILEETENRIRDLEKNGYPAVIFDAPQLFESGFNEKCDIIIAVIAPTDERIRRIRDRDSISEEAVKKRIASQLSDDYLISHSDYVIENNGDINDLSKKIDKLVKIILK